MSVTATKVGATVSRRAGDRMPCARCGRERKVNQRKGVNHAETLCLDCKDVLRLMGEELEEGI